MEQRRRAWTVAAAALALGALVPIACDSPAPVGHGDTVVNDTRDAEPRPPANPTPDDGSEPMGQPDAPFYEDGGVPATTYPGINACSTCSCDPAKYFCFGGAPKHALGAGGGRVQAGGDAGHGDASLPPCPIVSGMAVGCNALLAGATDCPSLLAQIPQTSYGCDMVCATDGTQLTVYCPTP